MFFKFHFIYLFFCLTLSTSFSQNEEFRATWVITWGHINRYETPWKNLERVAKIMDDHADANMNAVIFQVRQSGTAYYQSSYEPWGYYSGYQYPGYYSYDWTGLNDAGQQIASGIYFCTLGWKDKIIDSKKLIY